jgi:sortase family protein
VFTDLDKVQKGDLILLHVLGDTLAYAVDTITVTDPADIEAIEIRQDKDLVTLVTCTPYSVNTHRLLVRGHRIELTEEEITEETKATEPEASTWMEKYIEGIFFGFIIGGAVLVLVRALSKKVRENQ